MHIDEASIRELLDELIKRTELFVGVIDGIPGDKIPTLISCGNPLAQIGAVTVLRNHLCDKFAAFDPTDIDDDDDD